VINVTFNDSSIPHLVEVAKLAEAKYGPVYFGGVVVDSGAKYVDLKEVKATKKHVIEFIGDSITCGFGALGKAPCVFTVKTEDPTVSYAWQIAQRLDAIPNIVSWSRIGVTCNYVMQEPGKEMPKRYPYLFGNSTEDEPKWDFKAVKPDALMMFLGTSDYSCPHMNRTTFKEDYKKFWDDILNDYYKDLPDLQIIVGCGEVGPEGAATAICSDVREAVAEANNTRVHYLPLFSIASAACADTRLAGCEYQPRSRAHEFIFESAVQKIAEIVGWTDSFEKIPKRNIAASWGSSNSTEVGSLAHYCGTDSLTDEYTMLTIDAVDHFGKGAAHSTLHIDSSFCNEFFSDKSDLLNCSAIGDDISLCKSHKVKVLLTLGGSSGTYDLQSEDEAVALADELWDTYFGGNSTTRPFGNVSLDGINLDIQQGTGQAFYPALVSRLREKAGNSTFIVAVTTKDCNISNATREDPLMTMNYTTFRIRYMDDSNNCTVSSSSFEGNFEDWLEFAKATKSKTQILVTTDCNRTHIYDLDYAVVFAQRDGERFDGIAFDNVEQHKHRTLHPRILNSYFKERY